MSQTIVFSALLEIASGLKLSINRPIIIDAYDFIDVVIPIGTTDHEIALQPSKTTEIRVLAITCDWYGTTLSYKVNAGTVAFTLEEPLVLTGKGALSLMGTDSPTTLKISNAASGATARDAHIQILLGRKA